MNLEMRGAVWFAVVADMRAKGASTDAIVAELERVSGFRVRPIFSKAQLPEFEIDMEDPVEVK